MGRPRRGEKIGYITSYGKFDDKEYLVLEKDTWEPLLDQSYKSITDAKKAAKLAGIKISKRY